MCKKLESWDEMNVQEIGIVSIWKKRKILWRIYEKWPIYVKISLILSRVFGQYTQKYEKIQKDTKKNYRKTQKIYEISTKIRDYQFKSHKIHMIHGNINGFRVIKI